MKRGNGTKETAKSKRRPRNQAAAPNKHLLRSYVQQMVTLLALQQTVMQNLQKEIEAG
jgi:hypothetical protein